jgi:hypothetical protein
LVSAKLSALLLLDGCLCCGSPAVVCCQQRKRLSVTGASRAPPLRVTDWWLPVFSQGCEPAGFVPWGPGIHGAAAPARPAHTTHTLTSNGAASMRGMQSQLDWTHAVSCCIVMCCAVVLTQYQRLMLMLYARHLGAGRNCARCQWGPHQTLLQLSRRQQGLTQAQCQETCRQHARGG